MSAEAEEDIRDMDPHELLDELSDADDPGELVDGRDPFCETSVERGGDMTDAEEYADRLQRMEFQRESDDTFRGLVENLDVGDDSVTLEVAAPDGGTVAEEMHKPMPWSTEHKFARIVEEQGYGPGTLHMIEGERVRLERDEGSWDIHDPITWSHRWEHGRRDMLKAAGGLAALVAGVGLGVFIAVTAADFFVSTTQQMSADLETAMADGESVVMAMDMVLGLVPVMIMIVLMSSMLQLMAGSKER